MLGELCLPCPMGAHICSASANARMDTDMFNLGRCLPRRTSGNAAVNQQSQFRLPLSLAGAHATHADQEAVTAGRGAPAFQHLQRLLGHTRKKTTQQAALSRCWKQLFLRPPGALLPRGAAPRPHATPWAQAALYPKQRTAWAARSVMRNRHAPGSIRLCYAIVNMLLSKETNVHIAMRHASLQ